MANAQLINFTGMGRPDEEWFAADMLIFTKSTRLEMSPEQFDVVSRMPQHKKQEELDYMAKTIRSSWEFADVTFLLTGVTRATAQQVTRTRTGSYAMQSLRVADATNIGVTNPFPPETDAHIEFQAAVTNCQDTYQELTGSLGEKREDARGILPLNTHSNLVAKYNLRNFVELIEARKSLRAQGEYADLADQMEQAVKEVWPWSAPFFEPRHNHVMELLEEAAQEAGIKPGEGAGWKIAKAIDLLRKE